MTCDSTLDFFVKRELVYFNIITWIRYAKASSENCKDFLYTLSGLLHYHAIIWVTYVDIKTT